MTTEKTTKENNPAEEAAEKAAAAQEAAPEESAAKEESSKKEEKEEKKSKKQERELCELQRQLAEANEKYLRLAAEYDNFRKRSAKEKSEAYSEAYSDAVTAFLPLADSLFTAAGLSPDDEGRAARDKQLSDILTRINVSEIESDGKEFDPNLHNAIMHEEDPEKGENLVSQTLRKGYRLGEKVIRHAMVKVVN